MLSPFPLDIFFAIKAQIDPTLVGPHLLLSNLSRTHRNELYPHGDDSWKALLTSKGIGRSLYDLEEEMSLSSWRDIAVEVSRHQESCSLLSDHVESDDNSGAGGWLCRHVRKENYLYSTLPYFTKHGGQVFSPEEVRKRKIHVIAHSELGNDFDCQGRDANFVRFDGYFYNGGEASEEDRLLRSHPVHCHSFATAPPISFMSLPQFKTAVFNAEGVTHWDVRLALKEKYPYITQDEYFIDTGRTYAQDAQWLYGRSMGEGREDEDALVRHTQFLFPYRIFNGDFEADVGSCVFTSGTDS